MSKAAPRILLVEDEPDVCSAIHSFLGRRGFQVSTTASGHEALSIINVSKPDIVLLDLTVQDLSGKDVLSRLRKTDKLTKVIIITGEVRQAQEVENIRSLGVSAYLRKPISLSQLEELLSDLLGNKLIPKKVLIPSPKTGIKIDDDTRLIAHDLQNLLGIIRNKCEGFVLNITDGIYRGKPESEIIELAVETMQVVIKAVDRASETVDTIGSVSKKKS